MFCLYFLFQFFPAAFTFLLRIHYFKNPLFITLGKCCKNIVYVYSATILHVLLLHQIVINILIMLDKYSDKFYLTKYKKHQVLAVAVAKAYNVGFNQIGVESGGRHGGKVSGPGSDNGCKVPL